MAKNIARNIMDNTVAEKTARRPSAGHTDAISLYAADGHRKYLNLSERQRAMAAMESLDPDKALFALTLAWTGARVSEVLALTPASFQLDRGVVAIVTLKRRRFTVREVPVPGSLLELINTSFGLSAAQRDPDLSRRRLWPWHRVTAWRLIKQIMRQCGLTGCAASPRGFRHGFGVGALQAGAPLNLVQRWLGHATIGTTAIYADASGPEEQAFAGRFWGMVGP